MRSRFRLDPLLPRITKVFWPDRKIAAKQNKNSLHPEYQRNPLKSCFQLYTHKKIVQLAWSINTLIYVGHYCIRQYIKRGFLPSAATDKWKFISRISEQITQIIKSRLSFQLFKFYRDSWVFFIFFLFKSKKLGAFELCH